MLILRRASITSRSTRIDITLPPSDGQIVFFLQIHRIADQPGKAIGDNGHCHAGYGKGCRQQIGGQNVHAPRQRHQSAEQQPQSAGRRQAQGDALQILPIFPEKGLVAANAPADAKIQPQGGIIGQKGDAAPQADALNLGRGALAQKKLQTAVPAVAAAHHEKNQKGIAAKQPCQNACKDQQARNAFPVHVFFPPLGGSIAWLEMKVNRNCQKNNKKINTQIIDKRVKK